MSINKFWMILVILITGSLNAQEGLPIYSDYLTDNYYLIHPSMAGASNCAKLRVTGRKQWFDQDEAPNLQTLSFNSKISDDGPSAFGAIFFNDQNGYHSQTGGYVTYAHHLLLSRNTIDLSMVSFGLSVGVVQSRLDESEFSLTDFDPIITGVEQSATYFNVDFGVSYQLDELFAHFTVKNLLGSGRDIYTAVESTNLRRYLFTAGYTFNPGYSEWTIEPSVMFQLVEQTEEATFDFNAKVYKETNFGKVWGGLSYRRSLDGAEFLDGTSVDNQKLTYLTPFVGVNYKNFMFAYTYSKQTGSIVFENGAFHQITLGLDLFCRDEAYDCKCPYVN